MSVRRAFILNTSPACKRVRVEEVVEVEDQMAAESKQTEDDETDACKGETPTENETSTESSKERRYTTRKDEFERLYRESLELKPCKRKRYILEEMKKLFPNDVKIGDYVCDRWQDKERAMLQKRQRFMRKAHLNHFNYFTTFTYNDAKLDEATFKRKLTQTLQNFHKRRGWTYMGVWERGSKTERLHFHCLLNVPDGQMPGELVETVEYKKKTGRMEPYTHNTLFDKKYGRNEFDYVAAKGTMQLCHTIDYILKYIEKTGERIVCSRGVPTYVMSDIEEKDVITRTSLEDKKLLLFADFDIL
jgi:hypothetical protein